ncbi:hypothetical protein OAS23_02590 [Alphaproteobacteria bacterium]|nr:hypothetical protein [Alphaproteobacteria bacterium]
MFRFILIILVLNIVNFKALASEKYCLKKENASPIVINIFGESYQNKDDKRALLNGLNKISKSFNAGNKIRIVTHKKNNAKIQIDQCVPGCPKKGFIDKLVDTDCSDQVAKKDMVIFKNKYSRIIQSELAKGGDEYSVIDHLSSLDNYYRGRNLSNQTTYIFHSLLPYDVDPNDKKSFDKNFVKITQNYDLSEISLPDVTFINPNRSKSTLQFWNDLKLNENETGLQINFQTEVID